MKNKETLYQSYYTKNTWLTFAMVIAASELIRRRNKNASNINGEHDKSPKKI